DLFRNSDIITIHTRLSDRTRGLIGARELALMKPTAYLINTSRGPIVDEAALLAALQEGRIAGAALDVYDIEPLPADHPLRSAPRLLLTPHLGYVTEQTYRVFYTGMVDAIEGWLAGRPIGVIEPPAWAPAGIPAGRVRCCPPPLPLPLAGRGWGGGARMQAFACVLHPTRASCLTARCAALPVKGRTFTNAVAGVVVDDGVLQAA